MGYFKNVNVYPVRSQDDQILGDNYRDIYIEVEEAPTGHASLFFGLSSGDGIFGGLDVTETNFNYKGFKRLPKDGPSAGITMLTALTSAYTQRKVKPQLAMTGEITLRGKVLPVGGLKEKILAAKRAGIKDIILCEKNRKDILEINQRYLKELKFHYVSDMQEVIELALMKQKVKAPIDLSFKEGITKSMVN
jgi:hypothetical protein